MHQNDCVAVYPPSFSKPLPGRRSGRAASGHLSETSGELRRSSGDLQVELDLELAQVPVLLHGLVEQGGVADQAGRGEGGIVWTIVAFGRKMNGDGTQALILTVVFFSGENC